MNYETNCVPERRNTFMQVHDELTNFMQQSPYSEINSRTCQEFLRLLWNLKFYRCAHISSPMVTIFSKMTTVNTITPYFFKIKLILSVPSGLFPSSLPHQNFISHMRATCVIYVVLDLRIIITFIEE